MVQINIDEKIVEALKKDSLRYAQPDESGWYYTIPIGGVNHKVWVTDL